jgi:hypothetical protein
MAPPRRRRRITFEWAGEEFTVGEYAVPGPLWRVLQRAVCIVMDGGACGAALAAAVPPGAPGAAFLSDLVDEAAREEEWASGEEARGVLAELLGWMVENADEVMGQAEVSAGAGGAAAAVSTGAAGGGEPPTVGGGRNGLEVIPSGRIRVYFTWRYRNYYSSMFLKLDAATAAACSDVARITLRGREAAIAAGKFYGLNFPPDGPAPNAYITALLAAAPADDARWLAAGSGEPRHEAAFAAAHGAIAAYLEHIGHASAAAAAALMNGERVQAGYAGIRDVNGRSSVSLRWRGRMYQSSERVVLGDAATAAACADVARITLRGREAATVKGRLTGLNCAPGGPAPNDYITALLAAAPTDDARWLAAGSGEPRHEAAFAAAHAAIAAYLEHVGHASAGAARARAVDAAAGVR